MEWYFICLVALTLAIGRGSTQNSQKIKITKSLPYINEFEAWRIKFNRTYQPLSDEYSTRYQIFADSMKKIQLLNMNEMGTATYGATKFADLSEEEFKRYYAGLRPSNKIYNIKHAKIPTVKAPASFDWRDHGAVTQVKDQGDCGSCWAFSVTGNVEGQWKINKGQLLLLSEQELIDCDTEDSGCNGGEMYIAYEQIIKLGGLMSEADYPYKASDNKCQFDKSRVKANISDWVKISQNETEMASWLAANGPISIGINANAMMYYEGGISYPYEITCMPFMRDHGVLIVGYGVDGGMPYWLIKNSWGNMWGEDGYYRAYRGAGVCGLNKECTSAVV